jgi:hypothetical protein
VAKKDRKVENLSSLTPKQMDIVLSSYAAQRADCAAMFGASANMLGFAVSSLGLAIIFFNDPKTTPIEWLFLIAVVPWALLSYHSLMVGAAAGHSFECREYERLIAEEAPSRITYKEYERGHKVILGASIGERFINPGVAPVLRKIAWYYSVILMYALPLIYSVSIAYHLRTHSVFWAAATLIVAVVGVVIVALNQRNNVRNSEINDIRSRMKFR